MRWIKQLKFKWRKYRSREYNWPRPPPHRWYVDPIGGMWATNARDLINDDRYINVVWSRVNRAYWEAGSVEELPTRSGLYVAHAEDMMYRLRIEMDRAMRL